MYINLTSIQLNREVASNTKWEFCTLVFQGSNANASQMWICDSDNVMSKWTNYHSRLIKAIKVIWKQRCRRVFSNQTAHPTRLMQEIWSEIVPTLKSQYDGLKGDSDGVERQRIAFIQQWSSSPFLESVGIHIRWNYRVPSGICTY